MTEALKYKIFGLTVICDFPLHCCTTSDDTVDVYVSLTHHSGLEPLTKDVQWSIAAENYKVSSQHYYWECRGIGKFLVQNGCRITIEPEADFDTLSTLLLRSILGAIIYQRGGIVLTGSAVTYQNNAYLFLGVTGSGKSTLGAALSQRGFTVISDHLSVINASSNPNGVPKVEQGYPAVHLWQDSLDMLNIKNEGLFPVRMGMNKFWVPCRQELISNNCVVQGCYILTPFPCERPYFLPVPGLNKLQSILEHRFLKHLCVTPEAQQNALNIAMQLANTCFVKRYYFERSETQYRHVVDTLSRDIKTMK